MALELMGMMRRRRGVRMDQMLLKVVRGGELVMVGSGGMGASGYPGGSLIISCQSLSEAGSQGRGSELGEEEQENAGEASCWHARGERSEDQEDLLQEQGVQEAHPPQGYLVQERCLKPLNRGRQLPEKDHHHPSSTPLRASVEGPVLTL
uniref:Uncharacterized protein n=1 Tax=Triticum urartu TaxID=4572 RepID=A0A8R7R5Q8_TRIUA